MASSGGSTPCIGYRPEIRQCAPEGVHGAHAQQPGPGDIVQTVRIIYTFTPLMWQEKLYRQSEQSTQNLAQGKLFGQSEQNTKFRLVQEKLYTDNLNGDVIRVA